MKSTIPGAFILLALFCADAIATPAVMRIEAIEGEVRMEGYEDWIDVWSFEYAVDLDADAGRPAFSEFGVVKHVDKASPLLFQQATAEEPIPTLVIDFFKGGASETRSLRVRLSDVIVSGYSVEFDDPETVEVISLNFRQIQLEQTYFDGGETPAGTTRAYYDLARQEGGNLSDGPPPKENTAPAISEISDRNIPVNSSVAVDFTIEDADTSADFLALGHDSSNQELVPLSNIVFSGSGNSRTATITPSSDAFGSSVITLRVSDGDLSETSQFTLTVDQPEGPSISAIDDVVVGEGDSVGVPFTIGHPSADLDSLIVTASSGNQQLLPDENIILTGSGANRTAELTPAVGMTGESEVTITVDDGSTTSSAVFMLTVETVTPPPVIISPDRIEGVAGRVLSVSGLSVSDPAAGDAPVQLTIAAPGAILTVASDVASGLTSEQIQGNSTADVTISAPVAAMNATFSADGGLTYFSDSPGAREILLEATRSGSSAANIEVVLFESGISLWRATYFSDEDLNDPEKESSLWGDQANPTGDGQVNLLKYALGLSPLENHSSSSLPGAYLIEDGEQRYLAITIVRRTDDPTLEYSPEVSFDLKDWQTGEAVIEEHTVTPAGEGLEQVVYRHPLSDEGPAGTFIRLKVTRTSESVD